MPFWARPPYPGYGYHYVAPRPKGYPPYIHPAYYYVDPPPKPTPPAPYYVYTYPTYIPFNTNYSSPVLPSDYADLLEVALANNLAKLTTRFHSSLDELHQHYQMLRSGLAEMPGICRQRCWQLYQRCLRYAATEGQRRFCQQLYQRCLAVCPRQ
ncbi:MAG: hypothetical protein P4N59_24545 [Negativicutes bacterium]|nr:hypothetical protein [Negativicutes bacterium]